MRTMRWSATGTASAALLLGFAASVSLGQTPDPVAVEGQPLASNVTRLLQTLDFLGHPLPPDTSKALLAACKAQDAAQIQKLLDAHALFLVHINPEARVKVKRGPAPAALQQGGHVPVVIKIVNESTATKKLRVLSPQAQPIYAQGDPGKIKITDIKDRFLDIELYTKPPLTENLSGLQVEYTLALLHSSQAGKREAVFAFDIGQGTQDLGFR
ncbi:MAG: hypothetical protein NZO58_07455, partial [Gemmataceae bacterium]|nr:hypothetical protein [Gemmataceae bacterium]